MYIIFEEHQYAAEDVKVALHGISELQDINKNVSVSYVGYFYEPAIPDCVFILPKVLLNDKDQLVVGPNQTIDPKEIITPEGQQKYLTQEYRKFLYEFAIWIYRTIAVYHQHKPDTQAIYYRRLPRSGKGMRHQANTYLDIILSLIQFNQENQDFFLYTVKNIHSGHNKINWTRTLSHSETFLQNGTPIYLDPVNRKRQINFDEELFIIFFSILDYVNREYGFRAPINMQYELLTPSQFETYRKGYGRTRLKEIRYKYFSDKAVLLWELCYAFFDNTYQLAVNTDNKEYLLAKKYNIIFEAIIDELIGTSHDKIPPGLADQDDGKQVDHMYTDLALTSNKNREVYYIGDSKYYKMSTALGKPSVSKQYTYARNVIQWNIDLWKDNEEGKRLWDETGERFREVRLRPDSPNEGYDIIPNFFLSAFVDDQLTYDRGTDTEGNDLNVKPREENNPKTGQWEEKTYISTQFDNRLFDRDTLLLMYYDINFLFVIRMYARNKESEKTQWKSHVRTIFRKKIQEVLAAKFQFYAFAPKSSTCAKDYLDKNLKSVIGKVFSPFDNQEVFVLALEDNEQEKETNEALLTELREHFYVTDKGEFTLGQDPTEQLRKLGYTKGLDTPKVDGELMLLSTFEAKINDKNSLLNGTAPQFISGRKPNKSLDLKRIKYFAPIFNHEILGAYEIVSIGITYLEDTEQPMRLLFTLNNYRKFKKPINYGIDRLAAIGTTFIPRQLAKLMNEGVDLQDSFTFAFEPD
jgi:hypothetical protein